MILVFNLMEKFSASDLEHRLGCSLQVDTLAREFDSAYSSHKNVLDLLRQIKLFLFSKKQLRHELFNGTYLSGSDCLTIAILAAIIAEKKRHNVRICRPSNISHYFHAALAYEEDGIVHTFKLTGRDYEIDPIFLDNEQVLLRLKITQPIIDFVNRNIRKLY